MAISGSVSSSCSACAETIRAPDTKMRPRSTAASATAAIRIAAWHGRPRTRGILGWQCLSISIFSLFLCLHGAAAYQQGAPVCDFASGCQPSIWRSNGDCRVVVGGNKDGSTKSVMPNEVVNVQIECLPYSGGPLVGLLIAAVKHDSQGYEPVGKFVRGGDFPHDSDGTARLQYGPCGLNSVTHRNTANAQALPFRSDFRTTTPGAGDSEMRTLLLKWQAPPTGFAFDVYFRVLLVQRADRWISFYEGPLRSVMGGGESGGMNVLGGLGAASPKYGTHGGIAAKGGGIAGVFLRVLGISVGTVGALLLASSLLLLPSMSLASFLLGYWDRAVVDFTGLGG